MNPIAMKCLLAGCGVLLLSLLVPPTAHAQFDPGDPEIAVSGNGQNIVDGDTTPSTNDHTDFGSVDVDGGTQNRTFTIDSGNIFRNLQLGANAVTISGPHASDFTVTEQPPNTVFAFLSDTFRIQFNPSASGVRSATIHINNNDPNENPFDFAIQGTGLTTVTVTSSTPTAEAIDVAANSTIRATFSEPIVQSSVSTTTFRVWGSETGVRAGTFSFPSSTQVVFDPAVDFRPGEQVQVVAASSLQASNPNRVVGGYHWQFRVAPGAGPSSFGTRSLVAQQDLFLRSVAAADVDGDGDIDLIGGASGSSSTTPPVNSTLVWYENDGAPSPTFTATPIASSVGTNVFLALPADVDGDGDVDLISAGTSRSWYENDGAATPSFTEHTLPTGTFGGASFAADVNRDGHIDIVLADRWLRNTGSGSFTSITFPVISQNTFTTDFRSMATFPIDLDRDGDVDMVAGMKNNRSFDTHDMLHRVAWFENDGSDTFTIRTIKTDVGLPWAVAAGDLDGDGDIDVAAGSHTNDTAHWYENNGSQAFTEHDLPISTSIASGAAFRLVDLEGDGDLDILGENEWAVNNGSGSFTRKALNLGNGIQFDVAAADLDGDGDLDVVGTKNDKIRWQAQAPSDLAITGNAVAISDGDTTPTPMDHTDFETHPVNRGTIQRTFTLTNTGQGFLTFDTTPITLSGPHASDFSMLSQPPASLSPIDGTTTFTLAFSPSTPGLRTATVSVASNDPDENPYTFAIQGTATSTFTLTNPSPNPGAAAARSTPLTATLSEPLSTATISTTTFTVRGEQSGRHPGTFTFPSPNQLRFDPTTDFFPGEVVHVTASDGIQNTSTNQTLLPFHWQFHATPSPSTGFFSNRQLIGSDNLIQAADIDGDNDIDIVTARSTLVAWAANDGTGTFATPQTISTDVSFLFDLAVADIDSDGDLDVLSASFSDNKLAWYANDGAGTFAAQQLIGSLDGAMGVHTADINGDGDMDVVARSFSQLAVYHNNGASPPSFTEQMVSTGSLYAISVADVDQDGHPDLLAGTLVFNPATSATNYTIQWFKNDGGLVPSFTAHTLPAFSSSLSSLNSTYVNAIQATDLDSDGDLDILVASANELSSPHQVAWYENNGAASPIFTLQMIETSLGGQVGVRATDLDGDGDVDILAPSGRDQSVHWFENDGATDPGFTRHTLDTALSNAQAVDAADVDGDGDLDVLAAGAGTFWYEQQAPTATISGDAGWRMLSGPTSAFTAQQLADDTAIQGITGGSFPNAAANLFTFPQAGTWTTPTNLTTPWGDGLGFILYFFDNTTAGSSALPLTLNAEGVPPTTDVMVPLNPGGFTLLGNPFVEAVALDQLTGNGTGGINGLVSPIQIWDDGTGIPGAGSGSGTTGTYRTFNFGSSQGQIVASWQGFMVESVAGGTGATQATIPLAARTSSAATVSVFSKTADTDPTDRILALTLEGPNGSFDHSPKLYFHSHAHEGPDGFDGTKLTPLTAEYATLAFRQILTGGTERLLVQDGRAFEPTTLQTYDLALISAGLSGPFTLRWPEWTNIPDDWQIHLHDLHAGTTLDLRTSDHYRFEATSTTAASKHGATAPLHAASVRDAQTRFRLTVAPPSIATDTESLLEVPDRIALHGNYPNPFNPNTQIGYALSEIADVRLAVYDALGREVAVLMQGRQQAGRYEVTWEAGDLPSGVYVSRLEVGTQRFSHTMLLVK